MSKTRAVRLDNFEVQGIDDFLKRNPFFDFSTLARTAIMSFIQNPSVEIRPIKRTQLKAAQKGTV